MVRRTPALTKVVRDLFMDAWDDNTFVWDTTTRGIADATGLSIEQVRDAIWGKSADQWRKEYLNGWLERHPRDSDGGEGTRSELEPVGGGEGCDLEGHRRSDWADRWRRGEV